MSYDSVQETELKISVSGWAWKAAAAGDECKPSLPADSTESFRENGILSPCEVWKNLDNYLSKRTTDTYTTKIFMYTICILNPSHSSHPTLLQRPKMERNLGL